ncbi:MAG TPA: phosphate acetyltransferase [Thermoproteota archaeon]|nr:phosphate acetyltransferase [Thermoproteota archaeon]
MDIVGEIMDRARRNPKRIVLPEGEDERTLMAAGISSREGIADIILLGKEDSVRKKASDLNVDVAKMKILDPEMSADLDRYAALYCELRKEKNVNEGMARRILRKSLYFGAMMVRVGEADGMVAGAVNLTASVVRAASLIIGLQGDISTPSSFFLMNKPDFEGGEKGAILFADVAVNPDPTPPQLADIAISSARSAKLLFGWVPRVAMLSFSTKGSAYDALTRKVVEATEIAKKRAPDLLVDGEFQADAAIVPAVAKKKISGESPVAGRANVLVFPDLNAANIAYKLVQYMGKAEAYGPILQGFSKPVSDLSRGATPKDIAGTIAIICVEAQGVPA